jgi:predicted transposase YdaD
VSQEALPAVVRRLDERLSKEVARAEAATLWTATYVLMGLRYPPAVAAKLLQGVRAMKESATYQAIVEEGRALGIQEGKRLGIQEGRSGGLREGMKRSLELMATKRLGPPDAATSSALETVTELGQLERLLERLPDVSTWQELLAGLRPAPANGAANPAP